MTAGTQPGFGRSELAYPNVCRQAAAMIDRKVRQHRSYAFGSVFELLIPVLLIATGFAVTMMRFPSATQPKTLRPDLYPGR